MLAAMGARHRRPGFRGGRAAHCYGPVAMPRYFFVITYADHQIDDPDGTLLPADAAAIEYARRIITDLREERRPEEPEPSIAVKNAAGEVIYRFPSN
jgi:hypothetical protein